MLTSKLPEQKRAAPEPWSNPTTNSRVFECLASIDWREARVADVGAGRGHFSHMLGEYVATLGLDPRAHVLPCDLIPESFGHDQLTCQRIGANGRLPFEDASLDAAISIEVIEHVENQFEFLRELARVVRPGGLIVVTTPNTLNANSRLRNFVWGFPVLFDPLPLDHHDPRFIAGHIHPISPYFLAYNSLRSGLCDLEIHGDRTKKSAAFLAVLFSPILVLGKLYHYLQFRHRNPEVTRANAELIHAQSSWESLTSRTTILQARVAQR